MITLQGNCLYYTVKNLPLSNEGSKEVMFILVACIARVGETFLFERVDEESYSRIRRLLHRLAARNTCPGGQCQGEQL